MEEVKNLDSLKFHKYPNSINLIFCVVIPEKAGIQVNARSWFFWMPDQVRHDGKLWLSS
jgi:hypothetical protein